MSSRLNDTITARWHDLSAFAQEHIRRTRPGVLRIWDLIEEGYHFGTVEADTLDEAIEKAEEEVATGDYDTSEGTVYADIYVRNRVTGEEGELTVAIDPPEPECEDGHDHDWRSPYSVLGGIEENPGVWGHGGGVIIREVCAHCGRYRVTNTWAQRMDTGEQGLQEVSYEDADEDSLQWVKES